MLAVVAGYGTVGGFGFHGQTIRSDQGGCHQAQRTKTLGDGVGLDISVVVLAGPDKFPVPFEGRSHHVINQAVFIDGALGVHALFEFRLVDFFENVLETAVVLFENGVFGGQVQGPTFEQSLVKTGSGKASYGFFGIVHGHSHPIALVLVNLPFLDLAILTLKTHGQFSLALDHHVGGPVLVSEGMATNADRGGPVGYQSGNILDDDRFAEHGAVQ